MTEAELLSNIDPVLLRRGGQNVSEATSAIRLYLAGPMRGIGGLNFTAFDAAAAQLRALGYEVWSPAEHDRANGFDPTGMTGREDLAEYGFSLRDALIRDMAEVARSDAICLLPGWEFSKGATVELDLAVALGLRVDELEGYLSDGTMSEHEFLQGVLHVLRAQTGVGAIAHEDALAYVETRCVNCDDRKCMMCVFRDTHDECVDDCPDCCPDLPEIVLRLDTLSERDNEVRITSSTGGQKGAKFARFDLIPTGPLWAVAELYGYGASKYKAARNWELGYDWSLSYAALQRHANLFWSRENDDKETGLPHLAAVVFHALALMEYHTTHPEFDDRPEVSK